MREWNVWYDKTHDNLFMVNHGMSCEGQFKVREVSAQYDAAVEGLLEAAKEELSYAKYLEPATKLRRAIKRLEKAKAGR